MALSIAAYESSWYLADLLSNAATFASVHTRIVLHYNCRAEGSDPLSVLRAEGLAARVEINPKCVTVRPSCGSVLHAHLLNFLYIDRNSAGLKHPRYFVMQASNMRWVQRGWEAYVAGRQASVDASMRTKGSPPAIGAIRRGNAKRSSRSSALRVVLARTMRALTNGSNCFVYSDHEGSFWPWAAMREFMGALPEALSQARSKAGGRRPEGSMGFWLMALGARLANDGDALAVLDEATGAFEEHLLPSFYASRLLGSTCAQPRPSARQHSCLYGLGRRPEGCATTLMRWPDHASLLHERRREAFLRHPRPLDPTGAATNDVFALKVVWRHPNNTLLQAIHALRAA